MNRDFAVTERQILSKNIEENNISRNYENETKSENIFNSVNIIATNVNNLENPEIAKIEIPRINLKAPIAEGTTKDIMNKYVGHFENTSLWDGNIGLAAHNRGYPVNYFANIKDLQIGDEIIYIATNGNKTYLVNDIRIIEDTDWSYLQETKENKITLITCVENEPSYRRCVQGIEKNL